MNMAFRIGLIGLLTLVCSRSLRADDGEVRFVPIQTEKGKAAGQDAQARDRKKARVVECSVLGEVEQFDQTIDRGNPTKIEAVLKGKVVLAHFPQMQPPGEEDLSYSKRPVHVGCQKLQGQLLVHDRDQLVGTKRYPMEGAGRCWFRKVGQEEWRKEIAGDAEPYFNKEAPPPFKENPHPHPEYEFIAKFEGTVNSQWPPEEKIQPGYIRADRHGVSYQLFLNVGGCSPIQSYASLSREVAWEGGAVKQGKPDMSVRRLASIEERIPGFRSDPTPRCERNEATVACLAAWQDQSFLDKLAMAAPSNETARRGLRLLSECCPGAIWYKGHGAELNRRGQIAKAQVLPGCA